MARNGSRSAMESLAKVAGSRREGRLLRKEFLLDGIVPLYVFAFSRGGTYPCTTNDNFLIVTREPLEERLRDYDPRVDPVHHVVLLEPEFRPWSWELLRIHGGNARRTAVSTHCTIV